MTFNDYSKMSHPFLGTESYSTLHLSFRITVFPTYGHSIKHNKSFILWGFWRPRLSEKLAISPTIKILLYTGQ